MPPFSHILTQFRWCPGICRSQRIPRIRSRFPSSGGERIIPRAHRHLKLFAIPGYSSGFLARKLSCVRHCVLYNLARRMASTQARCWPPQRSRCLQLLFCSPLCSPGLRLWHGIGEFQTHIISTTLLSSVVVPMRLHCRVLRTVYSKGWGHLKFRGSVMLICFIGGTLATSSENSRIFAGPLRLLHPYHRWCDGPVCSCQYRLLPRNLQRSRQL